MSIDGLPLYKSSTKQLWPILIWVEELPTAPVMLVGLFSGVSKPGLVEEFLRPLVEELNELQQRGLRFGDKVVRLALSAFIADSPARAFAKATTYFNGKHGCLKCSCVGEHIKPEKKTVFLSVDAELRTDAGFRSRIDKDHHKPWRTPIEDLHNFNMIDDVVVAERLHHLDFGATEWRSFLHYISIVVLKDFMPNDAFNHFLLYFCGVTIFSSSEHQRYWPLAEKFLYNFVKDFPQHYGRSHMTSNVHNILHVSGDVAKFGPLDKFSAYRFENYLQIIKRYVRSGTKVTVQVAARMQEIASVQRAATRTVLTYPRLKENGAGIHNVDEE
uniref:Transposase domain-containing protein n=1 Tax=Anopheles maculatus TaxID=74869 RepID=A0A182SV77_9DIPT